VGPNVESIGARFCAATGNLARINASACKALQRVGPLFAAESSVTKVDVRV
jgi:hypothetical protein